MIGGRVLGSQQVKAKLATVRAKLPTLLTRQRLGDYLVRRMQDNFKKERNPDGVSWPGHAATTKPGLGILRKTENLYKSIGVVDGNPGGIFASATGAGFRIGVKSIRYTETSKRGKSRTVDTAVYGRVHQQGNSHVPQRKFIGIGAADRKSIADLVRREMKKALGA